jgi:hypothetical protein
MRSRARKDIDETMQDMTSRGSAYLSDAAAQGQRLAQDLDERLEGYTGKSSDAWLKDATRTIARNPWKTLAVVGVVAYVLGKLRA